MSYNPKPTRVWSRVQHPCTFTVDSSYNSAYSPLTGKTTSLFEADYYNKLLYKGNILQYKKNTSNLTKSQRYSQICKGMWTNRTKSYATQTQTYTNPNTSNLKQVNFINVPTNGNITYIPGPFNFNIPAPNGCISDSIKDGGSLLCNTIVNPCTNEVIDVTKVLECYPTSCSDVPGPIIDLCWNPKLDTWYPRQNLTMPTSGTKWPEGYKGLVSAVKPGAPDLIVDSTTCNSITLSWSFNDNNCIPISSYNIYQNGVIIQNVPYTTTSTTISGLTTGTYSFYITSISNTTESPNSYTVIYVPFSEPTISGLFYTLNITGNVYTYQFTSGSGTITFNSDITNAEILVVGPGGNGGPGVGVQDQNDGPGGGGGAGGDTINQSNLSFTTNQICNVVVGTNLTSSVFDTYNAAAGANGVIINGGAGLFGGGNGGQGGNNGASTPGSNGTQYSIGSIVNTYYSGGGGGGSIGPGGGQIGSIGGAGGGGKGSDSGVQGGNCTPGALNTGGGGGGGSSYSEGDIPIPGCPGGSGVVILSFQKSC